MDRNYRSIITIAICLIIAAIGIWYQYTTIQEGTSIFEIEFIKEE